MHEKEPSNDIESFSEQFEKPEKLQLYDGVVEVYDVKPEKLKTEVPVLVAPGWAANAEVFEDNLRELVTRDRRAISLGSYHGVDNSLEKPDEIPNAEWRKTVGLIGVIEEKGLERVDVVAHSEGAIHTLMAAKMYPEKFRSIVLVNPAGFIEDDSWPKMSARFASDVGKQYLRGILAGKGYKSALRRSGQIRTAAIEGGQAAKIPSSVSAIKHLGPEKTASKSVKAGKHFNKAALNPIATLREVFAIGSQDMVETLDELQKQGVNISILHAASDQAFPVKEVKERTAGKVKQFKTRPGSHNEIYLNAGKFTRAAERMLTAMED